MKIQDVKVGDNVYKVREYSKSQYCRYGGDKREVPLGTKGTVISVIKDTKEVVVNFENGINWHLDISEVEKTEKPIGLELEEISNIKQIVEKLSKNIDLTKKFDDIRVLEQNNDILAYTDVRNKVLYINSKCNVFEFPEIVKMLNGLVVHELGHIDSRLKIPSNEKTLQKVIEELGKDFDKGLLNILYDLEVHHQYNIRKMIKPTKRRELKEMLTIVRNKAFKEDKTDMILSMEYPITDFQKEVKKIVENRKLTIVEKYKRILKEAKKSGYKPKEEPITVIIFDIPQKEDDKGKKKGKKKQKGKKPKETKTETDKLNEKSVSIKEDIEAENKLNEVKTVLVSMGFSDEEIDYLCKKYTTKEIIKNVENLYKSFKDIIPELTHKESRDKVRNHVKSRGNRINGYRKIRSFDEIIDNPEDLMTIGKFDIEDIRVPTKIRRKSRGLIMLLRDVSGSVSSPPLDKIVRDCTTTLVRLAKQKQHKVGVMDFHSKVEPIKDRKGEILTTDYNIVLYESMKLKSGYSTVLTKALKMVNDIVKEKKMEDENLNLFIITDSYVDLYDDTKFEFISKKVNLIGIWCRDYGNIEENFKKFVEKHKGKIFKVEQIKDKIVANMFDSLEK